LAYHAIMRSNLLALFLLVLATAQAAPARAVDLRTPAEGRSTTLSLGAFAGGHFFAEGTNLGVARGPQASLGARSNAAVGVRASLGLGRWFSAEAELLGLATADRTYQRPARILGYRINAIANLAAGAFRPFVLVGGGAIQVASTDAEGNSGLVRDTDAEVHAGVGFDYRLVDLLSLRGDARVVQMPSKQSWGLTTDVEATLGAVVTFGGRALACNRTVAMATDAPAANHAQEPPAFARAAPAPTESPLSPSEAPPSPVDGPASDIPAAASPKGEATPIVAKVRSVSDLFERAKEIKFEGATSKLVDASLPFIEVLAAALVLEPGARLEIVSHTGDTGDAKKDLLLSKRRAEAVKHALVEKGASADQLIATGRGSEDPIAPNITRSGRMRNERIELHRAGASSQARPQ
jgi:outer membrane protein OmpA-like peptidoglycan-associated protein